MADEEASPRPWTGQDVIAEIEELKKHYAANYVENINTGEDDKKEIVKPGEHPDHDASAAVQVSSQQGAQGSRSTRGIDRRPLC